MVDQVKIELMESAWSAPKRATDFSVGYDLYATEDCLVRPLDNTLVGTGIKLHMPVGIEAQVRSRSGLAAKHGVVVLNSPGTIDPDYKGEVKVILFNTGTKPFDVLRGDRIAQLVFSNYLSPVLTSSSRVEPTLVRGDGGFGSTGISNAI